MLLIYKMYVHILNELGKSGLLKIVNNVSNNNIYFGAVSLFRFSISSSISLFI